MFLELKHQLQKERKRNWKCEISMRDLEKASIYKVFGHSVGGRILFQSILFRIAFPEGVIILVKIN